MKPRVGIFGLSGCWGEQIVILNCEDELLDLVGAVQILDFLGGSSINDAQTALDIAIVEGSVAGQREAEALRRIRERAGLLIACGSCACFGGVAGMDTALPRADLVSLVYKTPTVRHDAPPHRPLRDLVKVDVELVGCPIEKTELLGAIACLLNGDLPIQPTTPVCHDCKMSEHDCLLITGGRPCVGSISRAGCGARCPGHGVPCIGCRGPLEDANLDSLAAVLRDKGWDDASIRLRLRTFAAPVMIWAGVDGEA